jgi:Na+/H+-dicarboxylate symporter
MLSTLGRISLTGWIIIATVVGPSGWLDAMCDQHRPDSFFTPLSNVFLRMIKAIVVPLLFGSLRRHRGAWR